MSIEIKQNIQVRLVECATCSSLVALGPNQERNLRANHNRYFCSIGHSNYFPGETEAERLRGELAIAQEKANHSAEQARVAREEIVRLKKRISNGVCPNCHRHFVNLERHIKTKHG